MSRFCVHLGNDGSRCMSTRKAGSMFCAAHDAKVNLKVNIQASKEALETLTKQMERVTKQMQAMKAARPHPTMVLIMKEDR